MRNDFFASVQFDDVRGHAGLPPLNDGGEWRGFSSPDGRVECRWHKASWSSVHEDPRLFVLVVGRARWEGAAHQKSSHDPQIATRLAAAYFRGGEGSFAQVRGTYAITIVDFAERRVVLATDRMGSVPIIYSADSSEIRFGSQVMSVAGLSAERPRLSRQAIYDYCFFHVVPAPLTILEGHLRMPAGTLLSADQRGVRLRRHWTPAFFAGTAPDFAEASADIRARLAKSVESNADCERVGTFLSGGIDSSTVTGLLSGLRPGATTAYTVGFDAAGYDETKYSRLSAAHFGARTVEYQVTRKDVRELLPRLATTHDEPFGNASVLAAYCCARTAVADGQNRLLAGDGGDELFGGNERYRTQLMFERYGAIPGAVRRGLLEPLASVGWLSRVPLIRKGPGFVRQAKRPLPDRLQSYNFLERTSPSRVFSPDFLSGLDAGHPFAIQRETWSAVPDASTLDKMLFLDWQITLADNDLRKVDRACDLAGLEVTYPFLDDDIVDFSLAIPGDWKVRGPTLRHFFKRAMVGFLPDATLAKSKQGFGLPFGVWAKEDAELRDVIRAPVGFLQGTGIVQKAYVDELWRRHEHESAAYYGVFLWVLANLGMWLDAHRAKFS